MAERSITLDYKPLNDYLNGWMVKDIQTPEYEQTEVVKVYTGDAKVPTYFHTTECQQIVSITVTFAPYLSKKDLLTKVKESVDSVLTTGGTPDVATINVMRIDAIESTFQIQDCVITDAEIHVDLNDFVLVKFTLSGILAEN